MNYYQLKCFIKVAELKSFTKASKEMNLTPLALKKITRDLETTLGSLLFLHMAEKVILTEFGTQILNDVIKIIEISDIILLKSKNNKGVDNFKQHSLYLKKYLSIYENAKYLAISERASALEAFGDYTTASEHWHEASELATKKPNKDWSLARYEYCRKQSEKSYNSEF